MNSPTNADIADAFGITLSDVGDDDSDDEDDLPIFNCSSNKKSKKRKRSHNKNTAMLFGMFFMLAFFGSYIVVCTEIEDPDSIGVSNHIIPDPSKLIMSFSIRR